MIIFDLDGTLADCEHRRHFVDPEKSVNHLLQGYDGAGKMIEEAGVYCSIIDGTRFKPDWKSFYEACDKDHANKPAIHILNILYEFHYERDKIHIWSGRCQSTFNKTCAWFIANEIPSCLCERLKMRPFGDFTPDDQLKERWLDEAIADGKTIDFVFDDRPKVVRMWRRRGIFVFDCNQTGKEF